MRTAVRLGVAAAVAFASLPPVAARADNVQDAPAPEVRAALPDYMRLKPRMDQDDIDKKVVGGYVTGLPLVNSDPNTGFGFGARAFYFNNGKRDGAMFEYTPYRLRTYAQAFFTTKGWQFHTIDFDAPYLFDSPYRLRANVVFEKNTSANYYGAGERSLEPFRFPGQPGAEYARHSEFVTAISQVDASGTAYSRFNHYELLRPVINATVERDFFGGVVRALGGVSVGYVDVRLYDGQRVNANDPATGQRDVAALQGASQLGLDCASGQAIGCGGGAHNMIKLGLAYDTRDFEPDPNRGVFVDLTGEFSSKAWGSRWDYARLTFSPRVYWSPFPELTDLVVASRIVYSIQSDGVPFHAMNTLAFTDTDRTGLGGLRTLRGYKQDRFIGKVAALGNLELRWTFAKFRALSQRWGLMVVPFVETGRVFDSMDKLSFKRWKTSYGGGFRVAWNQATIIVVDYGRSDEDSGLYINFNHPF